MVKLRRYFFFFCKNAKNLGRSDAKRRKNEDGLTKVCDIILHEFKQKIRALGYWLPQFVPWLEIRGNNLTKFLQEFIFTDRRFFVFYGN